MAVNWVPVLLEYRPHIQYSFGPIRHLRAVRKSKQMKSFFMQVHRCGGRRTFMRPLVLFPFHKPSGEVGKPETRSRILLTNSSQAYCLTERRFYGMSWRAEYARVGRLGDAGHEGSRQLAAQRHDDYQDVKLGGCIQSAQADGTVKVASYPG
ncbi:hypothetical protein BGX38DRAFT_1164062 [Terfezia claveryi]|nr:hypothetical protein BGX38DRAFT_1242846 [Terfezia claveryi]KAF8456335.1 hypothetical protein BGX38DRAFT_1164062 [Terfezia claveryi]